MPTQLFQKLGDVLKQAIGDEDIADITTWDVLVDEIYHEIQQNVKFFAQRFDQLLGMFYQLLKTYQAEGTTLSICSNLFEIFVMLAQMRPILITKNQNRLQTLLQELYEMYNMVEITCDENWAKPFEGYLPENDFSQESTLSKQLMSYFNRIAAIYTYPQFNELFLQILPSWWEASENDWKGRYTLLMMVSQLCEDIEYPLTMKPFIDCVKLSLTHQHPKVRYAALQAIGQFSDDMKPEFQQVYGEEILPAIFSCTKDEVPRIQAHTMACLTNFLEDFETESWHILQPYLDEFINVAQNFCYNGISILKENTISALASLSSIDILTSQQVERILGIIHHTLTHEQHQTENYTHLIDLTVECLSMLLFGQAKEKIEQYLEQSVNVLKSLKTKIRPSYLINAWSRLCLKYVNFTDLSDIFPFILEKVFLMVESYDSEVGDMIKAVDNTLTSFKENIKPYMVQMFEFCKNSVLKQQPDDTDIRPLLYNILVSLVVKLKSEAPDPQYDEMAKQTFTFFYEETSKILNEDENEDHNVLEESIEGLRDCIKYVGSIFTNQNATKFAQNIFNLSIQITGLIQESNQEIAKYKQQLNNCKDELEQEEINEVIKLDEERIKKLHSARLVIPDTFESILTIIPLESAKTIIHSLYPHVSNYLQKNLFSEDIRYGLYFLCDFLNAVKYHGIEDFAQVYESTFCEHCLSPNLEVRNCAVFGLGEFMMQIPAEKTDENLIYKWLNLLWSSLSLSSSDKTETKKFNFAKDNIVSALGKLIFTKRKFYPVALNSQVHKKWLEYLPLNNDKTEGNIQHEILLKLLQETPETFISTKQDVFLLLNVFAKYFTKRMLTADELIVKNKSETKKYLWKVKDWPIFQENSDFLWNNLPMNQKTILTQLMSAP